MINFINPVDGEKASQAGVEYIFNSNKKAWNKKTDVSVYQETGLNSYTPNFIDRKFKYVINQNVIINNPLNQEIGQEGTITIQQDQIGSWDAIFDTDYIFANGQPDINDMPNAYNVFKYEVIDNNKIYVEYLADFN